MRYRNTCFLGDEAGEQIASVGPVFIYEPRVVGLIPASRTSNDKG